MTAVDTPRAAGRPRSVRVSVARAQAEPVPSQIPVRYVREHELRICVLGGIGASTLRRAIRNEGFPLPRKFSPRVLLWDLQEVDRWLEARRRLRGTSPKERTA